MPTEEMVAAIDRLSDAVDNMRRDQASFHESVVNVLRRIERSLSAIELTATIGNQAIESIYIAVSSLENHFNPHLEDDN